MKCADCRWYNLENEVCLKDGYSVFNPGADDPCEYADNMTVFDRITVSPEVLALEFVYCEEVLPGWDIWLSLLLGNVGYRTKQEAIAATVEKLKKVAE